MGVYNGIETAEIRFTAIIKKRTAKFIVVLSVHSIMKVKIVVFPLNNGSEYIVEQGLNEGDTIIAEGAGLLREGIEVTGKEKKEKRKEKK